MLDRKIRLRRGATTAVGMATAVALLASCGATGKDNHQNTLKPEGPAAHKILNLMTPFFWVAVVVGVGVVSATIFVALRFREKTGEDGSPMQTRCKGVLEVSWTIIPFLNPAVMAVPTVSTIFDRTKVPNCPNVIP